MRREILTVSPVNDAQQRFQKFCNGDQLTACAILEKHQNGQHEGGGDTQQRGKRRGFLFGKRCR